MAKPKSDIFTFSHLSSNSKGWGSGWEEGLVLDRELKGQGSEVEMRKGQLGEMPL